MTPRQLEMLADPLPYIDDGAAGHVEFAEACAAAIARIVELESDHAQACKAIDRLRIEMLENRTKLATLRDGLKNRDLSRAQLSALIPE